MKFLDLRKGVEPRIQVVEKIVEKVVIAPRAWWKESLKMVLILVGVSVSIWGVSHADIAVDSQPFSAVGSVSNIEGPIMTLENANGSDGFTDASYAIDISSVEKVETNTYQPLVFANIKIGDKVIVQGTMSNSSIIARRIISFTTIPDPVVDEASSTVATSTDDLLSTGTSTASSTPDSGGDSSDTSVPVASSTQETATTTESATSTDTTSSEETASSTTDTASSTETVSPMTDTASSTQETTSPSTPDNNSTSTTPAETPVIPTDPTPTPEATTPTGDNTTGGSSDTTTSDTPDTSAPAA